MAYAIKGSQPQYFIRLTSDVPLEDVISDPELAPVLAAIGELGLNLPGSGSPTSKP